MALRAYFLLTLLTPVVGANAQTNERPDMLRGQVSGPRRELVANAEIQLVTGRDVLQQTRSDSAGRFAFRQLAAAEIYTVRVRRLGYEPAERAARASRDSTRSLDILLVEMPAELAEVEVAARLNDRGRLAQFYSHRDRANFGYFFDPETIAKKNPRHISELMRTVPGARLIPGRFGSAVRLRGCRPPVYVDGVRIDNAELDEVVNMPDVDAVEVYSSYAGIPAQYIDRRSNCGAVVVWLKS